MVLKKYQNPSGGLNAAGRAFYNHHGSHLKPPVTKVTGPESAARRHSFCARMEGVPGPMKKPSGQPTRKALALSKWHCK
jgi:Domain of unknown function (DUF6321)